MNGTYSEAGTFDGYPYYSNGTYCLYWSTNNTQWEIRTAENMGLWGPPKAAGPSTPSSLTGTWYDYDNGYTPTITVSASGGGGSFVWGTTQSFTISGTGSSAIDTTYTWNSQSSAYKANNSDYYVLYMAGPDQASISYNQQMTEYYIGGTGGDISGTKVWTNLMSGMSETLTVTV